jgi:hypothetical protein
MSNGDLRVSISIENMAYETFIFKDGFLLNRHGREKDFLIKDSRVTEDIIRQILENNLVSTIYDLYRKSYLTTLPSKLSIPETTLEFSKITGEWLTENFEDISDDVMNGESIENVRFEEKNGGLIIKFDVDYRYGLHRNKGIKISERGNITIDLDETPIEGCGIEEELKERIRELIEKTV